MGRDDKFFILQDTNVSPPNRGTGFLDTQQHERKFKVIYTVSRSYLNPISFGFGFKLLNQGNEKD